MVQTLDEVLLVSVFKGQNFLAENTERPVSRIVYSAANYSVVPEKDTECMQVNLPTCS
jgi:hypothetical protein